MHADGLRGYGIVHASPVKAVCDWIARLAAVLEGEDALAHGLYTRRAHFADGHIHLSDEPGWGLDIDWDAVRRHTAK